MRCTVLLEHKMGVFTVENQSNHPLTVNFVSLGCAKNLVDSEAILGRLMEAGLVLVGSDEPADVTVINTCGFIAEARDEARENIEIALEQKQAGLVRFVAVTGCLAQYWQEKLHREFPGIDAIIGLAERERIADIIRSIANTERTAQDVGTTTYCTPFDRPIFNDQARLRLTDPCWSYLRISEGCDRKCTFCTIPQIRGPFRSKPLEAIRAEAEELVRDGTVELNLIGQETSSYGIDLNYSNGLAKLLRELDTIDHLQWIRVLYVHPATLNEATLMAMAECQKVVPYIDIPLQHINDRLLKLMNRRITHRQTEQLLHQMRDTIPDLTIRTTLLVGFPSETDREFNELLNFVREYQFEIMGVFIYSPEEGTPAQQLADQIPADIKQQRFDQLMQIQQEIAFEETQKHVGQNLPCLLIYEVEPEEDGPANLDSSLSWWKGRHRGQAPEIDGECLIGVSRDSPIAPGSILSVRMTERWDYDLIGQILP